MEERDERRENEGSRSHLGIHKSLRRHPKPPLGSVGSLNEAIRRELWFVDTMVASPFRAIRRQLPSRGNSWAQGMDEALWALEGMTRLPIKLMQAAFGESPSPNKHGSGSSEGQSQEDGKSEESSSDR